MQYSKFRVSTTFQMSNSNENWCQTATYFCLNFFRGVSDGKVSARSAGDPGFHPWLWQPTPVLLPGKSHGQKSLVGYSPQGHKELDTTEQLHFDFSLSCIAEGNGNPFQYSSLEKSQGQRSLAGYRPWDLKELDTTKHLSTVAAETTLGNPPLQSQFISSKYHTRDHRPIFTCSSEWSISLSKVTQVRDD